MTLSDFNVGDTVKVIKYSNCLFGTKWIGREGIIKEILFDGEPFPITATFPDQDNIFGNGNIFDPEELQLVQRTSNIPEPNDDDLV